MFKVGDKVRVIEYSDKTYIGLKGLVTIIDDSPYPIGVNLGAFGNHSFNQQQLTHDNSHNESEELENTTRYKTNSGKQLFDIFEDDLLTYEQVTGFYLGNTIKYLKRYKQKNGIEDLKKVKVYVDQLIKLEEKHNA